MILKNSCWLPLKTHDFWLLTGFENSRPLTPYSLQVSNIYFVYLNGLIYETRDNYLDHGEQNSIMWGLASTDDGFNNPLPNSI